MRLAYDIVDVFTDRPFAGNQLAVVHGAQDLSTEQCLALAREFNFSEITFPVPADSGEYSTRIFTPGGEIPFAGHPTLGTAWVLRRNGQLGYDEVTQLCGAGPISVRFGDDRVELSAEPRDLLGPLPDDLVAALLGDLGLSMTDLAGPAYVAGCGLNFAHVPVTDEAVERATASTTPVTERAPDLDLQDPFDGINLFALSGSAPDFAVHARVFVPGLLVAEDAATGSAAAGLGIALVASGLLTHGGAYEIRQGIEMGRPSQLSCRVEAVEEGRATMCHVAGQVHHIASGDIVVPPA